MGGVGTFRAVNIRASDSGGHTLLEETFNSWVNMEQPAEILHVHYFHNQRAHFHGYQVIYRQGSRDELEQQYPSRDAADFFIRS
jgi:hypothetical protein